MLLATTNTVSGRETAEVVGLVVGGEIAACTEMLEDARRIAVERMKKEARAQGANAIVGVRFSSASIMQNAVEILVYGTAVKLL
ncbi:MAG: heavy metal-binding domain-containing protein [Peptococcaceae bacterium]|nr:heavy metal-binding domain-containing protein [Peptococcaceae bacterium]